MRRKPQPLDTRTADMFDKKWAERCPGSSALLDATRVKVARMSDETKNHLQQYLRNKVKMKLSLLESVLITSELPKVSPFFARRMDFKYCLNATAQAQKALWRDVDGYVVVVGIDWWNGEPWRVERAKLVLCS